MEKLCWDLNTPSSQKGNYCCWNLLTSTKEKNKIDVQASGTPQAKKKTQVPKANPPKKSRRKFMVNIEDDKEEE